LASYPATFAGIFIQIVCRWHFPCWIAVMHDFHVDTILFLNPLLRNKQQQLEKAMNTPRAAILEREIENIRNRLCLEIVYAMQGEPGRPEE
jgi:hypothetical protein